MKQNKQIYENFYFRKNSFLIHHLKFSTKLVLVTHKYKRAHLKLKKKKHGTNMNKSEILAYSNLTMALILTASKQECLVFKLKA